MARVGLIDILIRAKDETAQGLAKAKQNVSQFGKGGGLLPNMASETKGLDAIFSSLGSNIGLIKGALATIAPIAALVTWYKLNEQVKAFTSEINSATNKAHSLDMTLQRFREIKFQGELMGIDPDALSQGFSRMQKFLGKAAGGEQSAVDTFKELGLSVQKLMEMKPEQRLEAIGEALGKLSKPRRIAIGAEIFGKDPAILKLATNPEALKESKDQGKNIGSITEQEAANVQRLWKASAENVGALKGVWDKSIAMGATAWASTIDWLSKIAGTYQEQRKEIKLTDAELEAATQKEEARKAKLLEAQKKYNDAIKAGQDMGKGLAQKRWSIGDDPELAALNAWKGDLQRQNKYTPEADAIYKDNLRQIELNKTMKKYEDARKQSKGWQDQIDTFGMSPRQAQIAMMEKNGVASNIIEEARERDKILSQLEQQKKLEDEIRSIVEKTIPPLDKYAQQKATLDQMLAEGKLTNDEYQRSLKELVPSDLKSKLEAAKTPLEKYREEVENLDKALEAGLVTPEEYGKILKTLVPSDVKSKLEEIKTPLQKVQDQLKQYQEWKDAGWITGDEYNGLVNKLQKDNEDQLANLQKPQEQRFASVAEWGTREGYQAILQGSRINPQDRLQKTNEEQLSVLNEIKKLLAQQTKPQNEPQVFAIN